MSTEELHKKSSRPQLKTLNGAFKLAEKWVNGMSGSLEDNKSSGLEFEGRPARLGIGAAVPRKPQIVNPSDPVERKLQAKIDAEKRRILKSAEESVPPGQDASVDEDSDEEPESKSQAFAKKRPMVPSPILQAKKKHK